MQALPNPLEDTSDVEHPKQITPMMGTLVRRLLHDHHTAPGSALVWKATLQIQDMATKPTHQQSGHARCLQHGLSFQAQDYGSKARVKSLPAFSRGSLSRMCLQRSKASDCCSSKGTWATSGNSHSLFFFSWLNSIFIGVFLIGLLFQPLNSVTRAGSVTQQGALICQFVSA